MGSRTSCRQSPPQYASAPSKLTICSYLFARWHLFRHVGYLGHQQQVDLFDLGSGVRVTCDVGYLCAKFSLPRPLCSRVMQCTQPTDRRQTKALLIASALSGWRHNKLLNSSFFR